jgi:hypothetical protein
MLCRRKDKRLITDITDDDEGGDDDDDDIFFLRMPAVVKSRLGEKLLNACLVNLKSVTLKGAVVSRHRGCSESTSFLALIPPVKQTEKSFASLFKKVSRKWLLHQRSVGRRRQMDSVSDTLGS